MLSSENKKIYDQTELTEELLNADSFGSFCRETLEIKVHISDAELERIEKFESVLAEKGLSPDKMDTHELSLRRSYFRYLQTQNHELTHFFQVLALPTVQLIWSTHLNWFKYEVVALIRALETGVTVSPNILLKPLDLSVHVSEDDENGASPDEMFAQAKFYDDTYKQRFEGLSIHDLIEGMAHAVSLQLLDEPEDDLLELSSNPLYSRAFDKFSKTLDETGLELRWKLLMFIYVCWFSLHSKPETEEAKSNPVKIFQNFCSLGDEFSKFLKKAGDVYLSHGAELVKQTVSRAFRESDLEFASKAQIAHMCAFCDLIELMEKKVVDWGVDFDRPHIESLQHVEKICGEFQMDFSDKFFLLRALSIPRNFVVVYEVYCELFQRPASHKPFSFSEESMFYSFFYEFRRAMKGKDVFCCEKHGRVEFHPRVFHCDEDDSFSSSCERAFGKPAREIFTW